MKRTEINFKRASTSKELHEILKLQVCNHYGNLGDADKKNDGFVTIKHDFELLKEMNDACAHAIAKHNHKVVGYALCMTLVFKDRLTLLKPMFEILDAELEKRSLKEEDVLVMGQICIAKKYRKQGIFRGLYAYMQTVLSSKYKALVTEVSTKNKRSQSAHYSVGFQSVRKHEAEGKTWDFIWLEL